MKTKVNSEAVKNINIIDRTCKNASKIVDELSINSSLKDGMWLNISKRLESINKKILSWFLITTSSISILVASAVLINSHKLDIINDKANDSKVCLDKLSVSNKKPYENSLKESQINQIAHKQVAVTTELLEYLKTVQIPVYEKKEVVNLKKITPVKTAFTNPKETSITMGMSSFNILPEVGLDYQIYRKEKGNKVINIYLGLSAVIGNTTPSVSNEGSIHDLTHPNYFSNVTLKAENTSKKSAWSGKIGYLLNKHENSLFKKNTLKLSVQRNINKHVKLGPELIMSNNFKSYYPGFGITVES